MDHANMGSMVGTTLIHRYRLEDRLGQGGMGVVYRGYDTLLNRQVAVKMLSATALGTSGKARLLREAQAVAQLNHPNIVTIYDAGEVDEAPYIIMELVTGQAMGSQPLHNLDEMIVLVCQVCEALEHAHTAGIIHRDLKPENILLTPAGSVKLMDFGLARTRGIPRLTEEGGLVGTFLYMAPELLAGQEPSVQSDLYALGVILYKLACGQPPFLGEDPLALVSQHLHATPIPPSTHNPAIPAGLETLILGLLSKKPENRPASAKEVRLTLQSLAAGEGNTPDASIVQAGTLSTPLDRMVRGQLVGRERELAIALQAWQKAQAGESGILLISGEPGIGKSRLAKEVCTQAQFSGGVALAGECSIEGSAPYSPFAQIILMVDPWPVDLPRLVLADLINLAPALRVHYPDILPNPSLEPQAEQQRMYESTFAFFAHLAGKSPVLLVLEDAHWADEGSLALARYLSRRFRQTRTPILLTLTFRESELTGKKGLNELLTSWNRERLGTPVKLGRLDRQATRDVLAALFAGDPSPELSDAIYHETDGNPFFIEEVCKALIESGQVYREDGRWKRQSMSSIQLPHSLRMAIEARLDRLPVAAQDVLHLAAVLGHRFEFDMLLAASEQDEGQIIPILEQAEQAQLLYEVSTLGSVTFEFTHILIPTTLKEIQSGMRRRRMHRRVIAVMEKLRPNNFEALSHHCLEAGEEERALGYFLKAAERARAAFANANALHFYHQAVTLVEELGKDVEFLGRWQAAEAQLQEDYGDTLVMAARHPEAVVAYQKSLSLVSPAEFLRLSRLNRKIGKTLEGQRLFDEAHQAFRQAETCLGQAPVGEVVAWWQEWILIQLDHIQNNYWQGFVQEMAILADKVKPAVEQFATPAQRSNFYQDLVMLGVRRERFVISEQTLEYSRQALAAALESGNMAEIGFPQFQVGFCLLWHGDLDKGEIQLQAAFELAEKTGDLSLQTRCLSYLTMIHRLRGQVEPARNFATRSLELLVVTQMPEYIGLAKSNQAWVEWREGKLDEAFQTAQDAWAAWQKTPQGQVFSWIALWPVIGVKLARDQITEAMGDIRQILSPAVHPQPARLALALQSAVQSWDLGQTDEVRAYLAKASQMAEHIGYL